MVRPIGRLSRHMMGEMMRQFDGNAAALWARSVGKFPPEPLRFSLNATVESLPATYISGVSGHQPLAYYAREASSHYSTSSMAAL